MTLTLELVSKLHDQDAMLGNHTNQCHQPDLGVNIDRRPRHLEHSRDIQTQERAANRHWHGNEHDQWIAERLKLRRQHQVNDDKSEEERCYQSRTFGFVLARLPAVIDTEVFRQRRPRRFIEHV